MGYRLRLHGEVREWLTQLCGAEPGLARRVGEAVVALLDTGECLGPPVVVPVESVFRPPDDPREAVDYSYMRQLEALQTVRRGVADVATTRMRVELQVGQLEQAAAKLGETGAREAAIQERLSGLRKQHSLMRDKEEKLTAASQRLQARVDAFRTRKEIFKARYMADEALRSIREAFAALGQDTSDLDMPDIEPEYPAGTEPSAVGELLGEIADLTGRPAGAAWPADEVSIPAGMMELRPGAPDDVEVGLLFVAEPADTALVVAWFDHRGGTLAGYQDVIPEAAECLEAARLAAPAGGSAADFVGYDAESFLDEFFPGAETEVEVGAAALAARSRAHALVKVRERMGVTRPQMATRMNVPRERVDAIECAEPGATDVGALGAYVEALGGRLEIISRVADKRVLLR
jgi:hypothetical protein